MSYGLHSRYTNVPGQPEYAQFPSRQFCKTDESFCNMWRTVGFFISFDVAVELCTLVSFIVIMSGGVQRRAAGWQIVSTLLLFCSCVQCVGMSIVVCPVSSSLPSAEACASLPSPVPTPNRPLFASANPPRPTSSTTTTVFPSQATTSMPRGPFAPPHG